MTVLPCLRRITPVVQAVLLLLALAACTDPGAPQQATPTQPPAQGNLIPAAPGDLTNTPTVIAPAPAPATATPTPTQSATPTASATPLPTSSPTRTPTSTPTPRNFLVLTPNIVTRTPSPTPTRTATPTRVPTATRPPTFTPTPRPTTPTSTPGAPVVLTSTPGIPASTSTPAALAGTATPAAPVATAAPKQLLTIAEVFKRTRPSVVYISARNEEPPIRPGGETIGTGIVLDQQGYILTNNHVVEGATAISVTLHTGLRYTASLVGGDPKTDTAVLYIDNAEGLVPADLIEEMSEVEIGQEIVAIGHALGFPGNPTITWGIINNLGLSIETDPDFQITIVDLIAHQAPINPGNSGGPLVDLYGRVIGINTAIVQNSGLGFAINIQDARTVASQLIDHGTVERGYLGIRPINLTAERINTLGLSLPPDIREGVLVILIHPGSPAALAGLTEGDVIVQLGEKRISSTGDVTKYLTAHLAGETIEIVYYRLGQRTIIRATLVERPPDDV